MEKEDWEQIGAIVDRALDFEGEQQTAFLREKCGKNTQMLDKVEKLIENIENAAKHNFLETPDKDREQLINEMADNLSTKPGVLYGKGDKIGDYEIIEVAGTGGMGVVYKAMHHRLNREAALKFISSDQAQGKRAKERFLFEARAVASLDHQNICTVYEAGETEEGSLYIAMAYYKGLTLQDRLEKNSKMEIGEAVELAIQTCRGLTKAHAHRLVHRDIKPANLLVSDDGTLKILDFGIAKGIDLSQTLLGVRAGTPAYMAPEQIRSELVDHRADIWSIGVLIYQMITGINPFKRQSETATIYSILEEEYEDIRQIRTDIPASLEKIINKCLEKNPSRRYQQITDVTEDLSQVKDEHLTRKKSKTSNRDFHRESKVNKNKFAYVASLANRKISYLMYGIFGALSLMVMVFWYYQDKAYSDTSHLSIAVLPFENLNPDMTDEYLVSGISDNIINNLSKIASLRVISRWTSRQYSNANKPPAAIGKELNVSTVLGGTIARTGESLRISVQLINTQDGEVVWSELYDQKYEDIFEMQSKMARQVTTALQIHLTAGEIERIEQPPTNNLAAYELLLMGHARWNDLNRETIEEVVELYQMAIDLDPDFTRAHAYLALAYSFLADYGDVAAGELAPVSARKALQIDSTSAIGHFAMGAVLLSKGHLTDAQRFYQKSIAYDPNFEGALIDLGTILLLKGRFDESLYWTRRSLDRAPDAANNYYVVSRNLIALGTHEIANSFLRIGLDKETSFGPFEAGPKPFPRISMSLAVLDKIQGNYNEALLRLRDALEIRPNNRELLATYADLLLLTKSEEADRVVETLYANNPSGYRISYAVLAMRRGEKILADSLLSESLKGITKRIEEGNERPGLAVSVAGIYSIQENNEQAVRWLHCAYDMGYRFVYSLEHDYRFENIREEPGFTQIIEQMHSDISRMRIHADFSGLSGN